MGARLSERIMGLVNAEPYEDEGFMVFIRDHKAEVRNRSTRVYPRNLTKSEAMRFDGDFFAYLRYLGYGPVTDWVNLIINGMSHPSEFRESRTFVQLIDEETIHEWYLRYKAHLHPEAL